MKSVQNLPIAVKILIPPAVLALALGAVSLLALYGLDFQRKALGEINDVALDRITLVDEFIALSEQVQSDVFRISVLRFMDLPEDEIQPIQERMEQGLNDLNVIYGQILDEWSLDEEEQAIVGRMKEPLDAFRQQARQAVAVASDNPSFGVILVRAATVPFAEFRSTLAEFLETQKAKIVRARTEAARRAMTVSTVILALALGITLVAMVATVLISNRLIAQPIRAMTDLMGRLADGDLSIKVGDIERQDEIGGMAQAVEVFRRNALEKAQAEKALRESEEQYRGLFERVPVGLYRSTPDGQILDANPVMVKMLRYPDQETLLAVNAAELYANPDERGREMTLLGDEGIMSHFEMQLCCYDGGSIWVRDTFQAIRDAEGQTLFFEGSLEDITARKQAQEKLREHSERLEEMVEERTLELRDAQERLIRQEKLAVLGQLAGGVGHELRNPLGNIKNAAYFLRMDLQDPDAGIREMLEILDKEVDASEKIISSLLDYARARPPIRCEVDLNKIVREALSRAPLPDAPPIEVVLQLDADLPPILADPDQLYQVFGNILRNGIQAMSPRPSPAQAGGRPEGRLVIRTAVKSPEWVTISMTDNGAGISKENLKRIFEPLFTTRATGIGLGLALVKTLVEGHGGTIGVESRLGEGSTFTVRLPLGDSIPAEGEGA